MANLTCPRCGRNGAAVIPKGFGWGKALAGVLTVGPLGALAGAIGSGKPVVGCAYCGFQGRPEPWQEIASSQPALLPPKLSPAPSQTAEPSRIEVRPYTPEPSEEESRKILQQAAANRKRGERISTLLAKRSQGKVSETEYQREKAKLYGPHTKDH